MDAIRGRNYPACKACSVCARVIQAIADCVLCFLRHELHRGLQWTKQVPGSGEDKFDNQECASPKKKRRPRPEFSRISTLLVVANSMSCSEAACSVAEVILERTFWAWTLTIPCYHFALNRKRSIWSGFIMPLSAGRPPFHFLVRFCSLADPLARSFQYYFLVTGHRSPSLRPYKAPKLSPIPP